MTKTNNSAAPCPDAFVRIGVVADAVNVAGLREELGQWLRQRFNLAALRVNDVVLAVNEALANVAEFAYRKADHVGTVDVSAECDPLMSFLTITIVDRGCWRDAAEREPKRTRGRGIPLMEALSDELGIEPTTAGTTVRMRFGDISPAASCRGDEVSTA
jgi:serine/threonine-protein kinase RsbW